MPEVTASQIIMTNFKTNFVFYSVIALLLSSLGSWFTKLLQYIKRKDRKDELLDKTALELLKYKEKTWNSPEHRFIEFPAIMYYFHIQKALKENTRKDSNYENWLATRENELSNKIGKYELALKKLEDEEQNHYHVKESNKIPDSLKKDVEKVIESLIQDVKEDRNTYIQSCTHIIDRIHNIYASKHREETEKQKEGKESA